MKDSRRIVLLSFLGLSLYLSGIISFYYYPENAHQTYLSENALMPGSARVTFDYQDFNKIQEFSHTFSKLIWRLNHNSTLDKSKRSIIASEWIQKSLNEIGIESFIHKYPITYRNNNSSNSNNNNGNNIYSVLRAPHSDGTESIILSGSFNSSNSKLLEDEEISSVGLLMSIMRHLYQKGRNWLAKDIVLLISDTCSQSDTDSSSHGIRAWIDDYHDSTLLSSFQRNYFPRAGQIQAAINIDVDKKYSPEKIFILPEGSNGQLPNLDLINTIGRLAKRESVSDKISLSLDDPSLHFIPNNLRTLAKFMLNQASGVPTGDHGMFNSYHIDSVTVAISNTPKSALIVSRLLVGTVRSLNNLLERLHQSFYYYLLPSPFHYVSIGEYMISLGLIISPLVIRVLYLLFTLSSTFKSPTIFNKKSSSSLSTSSTSIPQEKKRGIQKLIVLLTGGEMKSDDSPRDILYSFSIVCLFQLIGILAFSLPLTFSQSTQYLLNYLSNIGTLSLFILFTLLYLGIFLIILPIIDRLFYPNALKATSEQSLVLKYKGGSSFFVFSNLPILIFLSTMSLLNFSFCTFASIFSIPLCTFSFYQTNIISTIDHNGNSTSSSTLQQQQQQQKSSISNSNLNRVKRLILNVIYILLSPPGVIVYMSHFVFKQDCFAFISTIIQQYHHYSNLMYPFLTLIYLPLSLSILKSINNSTTFSLKQKNQ
ncbi:hypothetical protein CYY_005196 [Polysphondylium violaceum]|uniref:Uncharacterized protein n=1 Tax=Polysphondylium violaceum TaxID=133409 RepID=A0A8J4V4F7_9MYCE|nr:hypothetical protein CYY_005196 [Polysphondylium violaceum]